MSDDVASTLTVAKLKALCILNDLPTSGKKSDLVERLLESGLSNEEVGLPNPAPRTEQKNSVEEPEEDEVVLSLEDEATLTPEIEPEKEVAKMPEPEDEVLEAEVMDAEIMVEEAPVITEKKAVTSTKTAAQPATLLDMVKRPQVAAALLTLMILGAGGYYYINSQLEPFTADQLRYGDEMRYTVKDGTFLATDEFIELVLDQLETDEEICKLSLLFEGDGLSLIHI